MQPITPPLQPNASGPEVANLQDALFALLDRDAIKVLPVPTPPSRIEVQALGRGLKREAARATYGPSTQRVVTLFQVQHGLGDALGGIVEASTAEALNRLLRTLGLLDQPNFLVHGIVSTTTGTPVPGARIRAFDRDLRKEQLLGEAKSDASGTYLLQFARGAFAEGDVRGAAAPRLIVRVWLDDRAVAPDVVRLRPSHDEVVNFQIEPRAESEWDTIAAAVAPLLAGQGEGNAALPPWELREEDLGFLAEETGLEIEKLRAWRQAHESARALGRERDDAPRAAMLYGWLRRDAAPDADAWWTVPPERLIGTLRAARLANLIPEVAADPEAAQAFVDDVSVERALRSPTRDARAPLSDLLASQPDPLSAAQQRAVARRAGELRADDPKLAERIAALPGFDGNARAVARTLRVAAFSEGHLPLVQALQQRLQTSGDASDTLQPLSGLRADEWLDLVYQTGLPAGDPRSPADFARTLATRAEAQHPTAALRAHLGEGRRLARVPLLADVAGFLARNPTFDVATANLTRLESDHDLGGVADSAQLRDGLRTLQRLQTVGLGWSEAAPLFEAGIVSPHQILIAGPGQLAQLLSGQLSPDRIAELYSETEDLYGTTLGAFTAAMSPLSEPNVLGGAYRLPFGGDPVPDPDGGGAPIPNPLSNDPLDWLRQRHLGHDFTVVPRIPDPEVRPVFPDGPKLPPAVKDVVDREPTLQALFGPQGACACRHCASVLGPAAYFVDILQFLKDAGRLEWLFSRRPDLQDLELSCENTDTEVPSIDLVLEILENAVALPLDVPLPAGVDADAELAGAVGPSIRAALEKTVRSLTGEVRATAAGAREVGTSDWTIVDGHRRWTITVQRRTLRARTEIGATRIFDATGLNLATVLSALDGHSLATGAEAAFAKLIAGNALQPPPLGHYEIVVAAVTPGRAWTLTYRGVAEVELDPGSNTVRLKTAAGQVWWDHAYTPQAIAAVANELAAGGNPALLQELFANQFAGLRDFTYTALAPNRWSARSVPRALALGYSPAGVTLSALTFQSGDTSVDALAWPENQNPEAYRILNATAVFPWTLPFDLPLATIRLCLDRARLPRRRLIERMEPTPSTGDPLRLAREVLGLSATEARLIAPVNAPTDDDIFRQWGIAPGRTRMWDGGAASTYSAAGPLALLQNASILLQQSRLTFDELLPVLETRFVRGTGTTHSIGPRGTCVPSELRITGLTTGHLDRLHRFVRLQRRLGWPVAMLDEALQVAAAGTLNDAALQWLADLLRLGETVDLPPRQVLRWWTQPTLDSGNQRERELARSLSVPAAWLNDASALLAGAARFDHPSATRQFFERTSALMRSGLPLPDLRYLLQHEPSPGSDVELDPRSLRELAEIARTAVRSVPGVLGATAALDPNDQAIGSLATDASVAALANQLGATADVVGHFLRTRLRDPQTPSRPAVAVFLEPAFFIVPLPATLPPAIATVLLRLHKANVLVTALGVTPRDLAALRLRAPLSDSTGLSVLDFNALPTATGQNAPIAEVERLIAYVRLRDRAPGAAEVMRQLGAVDFVAASATAEVQRLLGIALALGTTTAALQQIGLAATQVGITAVAGYRDPLALQRLVDLLVDLKQLGATVEQARGFIATAPADADAATARAVLERKYEGTPARDLLKPIADALREQQRDALADLLLARDQQRDDQVSDPRILVPPHLRSREDLYEYYLIDLEISSCLKTTRLLQATAAAQLYVQRTLLNLEGRLPLPDDKRQLWEWMQRYRVWEANRKVFLYPENWLLPELRDDKTVLFEEMEGTLAEQEPSLESSRAALLSYLEGFSEIAQATTVAMFEDRRAAGTNPAGKPQEERTLYVVGRTPNQPFRYLWRACRAFGTAEMVWDGWEPLDLDNANDFIMPFVFEGQLHVAWPTFRSIVNEDALRDEERRQWEVQLAWMRHTPRGWTKRKFGHEPIVTRRLINKTPETSFTFRLRPGGEAARLTDTLREESIIIDCYAAVPQTPDPTNPKPADEGAVLAHSGGETHFMVNVNLDITCHCWGKFTPPGETTPLYENLTDVTLTLEYFFGYWGGGYDEKVQRIPTTGRLKPLPLLVVQNAQDVKATFTRPGPNNTVEKKGPFTVTLKDNGREYGFWSVDYTVIFDLGTESSKNDFDPNRPVFYKNAGAFALDSLHDVSVLPNTDGETLPMLFAGKTANGRAVEAKVAGNGFAVDTVSSELPLLANAATPLDHDTGGKLFVLPASGRDLKGQRVLYLRDGISRCYIDVGDTAVKGWPDGQAFVNWYRRLVVAATFAIFNQETQDAKRDAPATLPSSAVRTLLPAISFDRPDPYANYNWELFLHLPLALADHLARNQRFAEARQWLHAVFDPTAKPGPKNRVQFWRFLPFHHAPQPQAIATLLAWLADPQQGDPAVEARLVAQITAWKQNPFMPHLVARLRPSAYQWHAFFAYVELLIAWGDQLFRRDTRESVNEATLLYVLARKLLGPRPPRLNRDDAGAPQTYRSLPKDANGNLAHFSEAWLAYADLAGTKKAHQHRRKQPDVKPGSNSASAHQKPNGIKILASLGTLAFCVPENEKIAEFHDRIDLRLFRVRHCQNIEGITRELPLFEPPIDPLLLMRARAAGLDLDTVLTTYAPPLPRYRFTTTLQRAVELTTELKALGAALLAALERKDTEELALLQSRHEVALLKLVRDARQQQVAEADANIATLEQSKQAVKERFTQYQKLLGKTTLSVGQDGLPLVEQSSSLSVSLDSNGASGLALSKFEIEQFKLQSDANVFTQKANVSHIVAGVLSMIPNFWSGNSMAAGQTFGGSNLASGAGAIGRATEMGAVNASYYANKMGMFASYERRQDEWVFQSRVAVAELRQIDQQLLAARIRREIADFELRNHDTQIEHATANDEFLRSKFTGYQLHRWMAGQLAEVYFRSYQLALEQARRAELACRSELAVNADAPTYVRANYWDSLKKGLLAGEQLHHDLRRLESGYLDQNRREFEITKHVALTQLDPVALIVLKEVGKCSFAVPEALFDLDFPGHYLRRIKTVALTLPCVTGPYASLSCTLTLNRSAVRQRSEPGARYAGDAFDPNDTRFRTITVPTQAIVTSNAQVDTGLFETNLQDERYLPFEGAGAISEWTLELANDFRAFDFSTISDVILHLRYTARDASSTLKQVAADALKESLSKLVGTGGSTGLTRVFSLRHEFPTEWHRFLNPPLDLVGSPKLTLPLGKERFPYLVQGTTITLTSFDVVVSVRPDFSTAHTTDTLKLSLRSGSNASSNAVALQTWSAVAHRLLRGEVTASGPPGPWTLAGWRDVAGATERIDPQALEDLLLICHYKVS